MTTKSNTEFPARTLDMLKYIQAALGGINTQQSYVTALFTVANHGPMSLTDLADQLGVVRTTMTRLIGYLGVGTQEHGKNIQGLGYVHTIDDPKDSRRKLVQLTFGGHKIMETAESILEGKTRLSSIEYPAGVRKAMGKLTSKE